MELEKVALEVAATKAGLAVVKGAIVQGRSGVDHRFAVVVSDGVHSFAFDFYEGARDVDVLSTYVKKYDTGLETNIVSSGKNTPLAATLAQEYGMKLVTPESVGSFFDVMLVQART
ncbi:MAG: hypothetical protein HY247_02345 [archaeon]|nr:MAG: hypothetical protein HY247_02345 [archaeon]